MAIVSYSYRLYVCLCVCVSVCMCGGEYKIKRREEIAKDGGKSEIPFFGSAALKERVESVG